MDDGGGVYVGEIVLRSDGFYYKVIAITSAYVEYQSEYNGKYIYVYY